MGTVALLLLLGAAVALTSTLTKRAARQTLKRVLAGEQARWEAQHVQQSADAAPVVESFTLGWANTLITALWVPVLEKHVSLLATEKLQLLLRELLVKFKHKKPWSYINNITVEEVTFGLVPPRAQHCLAQYDPRTARLQLSTDVTFASSGLQAVLLAGVARVGPLQPFNLRLQVTRVELSGRLLLGLSLCTEPPGIKCLDYSFASVPHFDLQAVPVGCTGLPGLGAELPALLVPALRNAIIRGITRKIVAPHRKAIDVVKIYNNKHVAKAGGPGGLLRVVVVGAREQVPDRRRPSSSQAGMAGGGSSSAGGGQTTGSAGGPTGETAGSDMFVELRFGREVFRTPIVHTSSRNPVWNWQFDMRLRAPLPHSPAPLGPGVPLPGPWPPQVPAVLGVRLLQAQSLGEPQLLSEGQVELPGLGLRPNGQPQPLIVPLVHAGKPRRSPAATSHHASASSGGHIQQHGTLQLTCCWQQATPKRDPFAGDDAVGPVAAISSANGPQPPTHFGGVLLPMAATASGALLPATSCPMPLYLVPAHSDPGVALRQLAAEQQLQASLHHHPQQHLQPQQQHLHPPPLQAAAGPAGAGHLRFWPATRFRQTPGPPASWSRLLLMGHTTAAAAAAAAGWMWSCALHAYHWLRGLLCVALQRLRLVQLSHSTSSHSPWQAARSVLQQDAKGHGSGPQRSVWFGRPHSSASHPRTPALNSELQHTAGGLAAAAAHRRAVSVGLQDSRDTAARQGGSPASTPADSSPAAPLRSSAPTLDTPTADTQPSASGRPAAVGVEVASGHRRSLSGAGVMPATPTTAAPLPTRARPRPSPSPSTTSLSSLLALLLQQQHPQDSASAADAVHGEHSGVAMSTGPAAGPQVQDRSMQRLPTASSSGSSAPAADAACHSNGSSGRAGWSAAARGVAYEGAGHDKTPAVNVRLHGVLAASTHAASLDEATGADAVQPAKAGAAPASTRPSTDGGLAAAQSHTTLQQDAGQKMVAGPQQQLLSPAGPEPCPAPAAPPIPALPAGPAGTPGDAAPVTGAAMSLPAPAAGPGALAVPSPACDPLQQLAQTLRLQSLVMQERAHSAGLQHQVDELQRTLGALRRIWRAEGRRALLEGAGFLWHHQQVTQQGVVPPLPVLLCLLDGCAVLRITTHPGSGGSSKKEAAALAAHAPAASPLKHKGLRRSRSQGRLPLAAGSSLWAPGKPLSLPLYLPVHALQAVQLGARLFPAAPATDGWASIKALLLLGSRMGSSSGHAQESKSAGGAPAQAGQGRAKRDDAGCLSLILKGGAALHLQLPPQGNGRSIDEWARALEDLCANQLE